MGSLRGRQTDRQTERERERERRNRKSVLPKTNERAGRWQQRVFRYSSPSPSSSVCVCALIAVARSTVILSLCTEREKEKESERTGKKERRVGAHTHILQQCTLDNYDLWPKRMRAENIILSKDNRCHRRWLIVNKNNNHHHHCRREDRTVIFLPLASVFERTFYWRCTIRDAFRRTDFTPLHRPVRPMLRHPTPWNINVYWSLLHPRPHLSRNISSLNNSIFSISIGFIWIITTTTTTTAATAILIITIRMLTRIIVI